MPNQVIPVRDLGNAGVVLDTPAVSLPPNVFSDARNVRFNDGAVRKIPGEVDLTANNINDNPTTQGTLRYLAFWPNPNRAPLGGYYVYVQDVLSDGEIQGQRVYIQDETGVRQDVTPTSMTNGFQSVTSRSETSWQHTLFAGGFAFIINNGRDAPHFMLDPDGNEDITMVPRLAPLPGWDSYTVNEQVINAEFNSDANSRVFDLGQAVDFNANTISVTVGTNTAITISDNGTTSNIVTATAGTTTLTFNATSLPDTTGDATTPVSVRVISRQTVTVTAGVVRAFSDFLVAGNLTETFVDTTPDPDVTRTVRRLTGVVRTSDVASAGAIPNNWNPFAAGVSTADEFILSDTAIVQDMAELQGNLYIYTNSSIHSMSLTGNTAVPVRVNPVTDQYGVQSTNAVLEYDGKHFVIGSNDIYLFGGHPGNIQSVSDGKIRRYFYDNINPIHERALFTLLNQAFDEIWVCYPTLTSLSGESNEALIWNYRDNTWSIRDLNFVQGGAVAPIPGGGTPNTQFTITGPGGTGTPSFDTQLPAPAQTLVAGVGAQAPSVAGDVIVTFVDLENIIIELGDQVELRGAQQGVFNSIYTVIIIDDFSSDDLPATTGNAGEPFRITLQSFPTPGAAVGENPPRGNPQYFIAGTVTPPTLISGEATSLNQGRLDAQNLTLPSGVEGINEGIATQFTLALSGDAVSFDAGDLSQVDVTFTADDETDSTDDQTPFGSGPNLRNAVNTISFDSITVNADDEVQVNNVDNNLISLVHDAGVEAGGGRLTLNYADTSVSPNEENAIIEIGDIFSGGNAVNVSNTGDQSNVGIAGVNVNVVSSTRVNDVSRVSTTGFVFGDLNRTQFDERLEGTGVTQQAVANDLNSVTEINITFPDNVTPPSGLQKEGGVTRERSTSGSNVAIFRQVFSTIQNDNGSRGNFTITGIAHPGTGTWSVSIAGTGVSTNVDGDTIISSRIPDPDAGTTVTSMVLRAEFSFDLSTSETINQRSIIVTNNSNQIITNAAIASGERGGFVSDYSLIIGETLTLPAYDSNTAEASVPWTFSGNIGGTVTTVTRTALLDNLASYINADGSAALADWQAVRDGTNLVLTSEVFGGRTFSSASFTGFVGETTTITGEDDSNNLVFSSNGAVLSVTNNRTGLDADVVNLRITANVNQTGQVPSDISLADGVEVRDQLGGAFAASSSELIWIPNMTQLIPAGDAVDNRDRGAGRLSSSAVTLAAQFGDAIGGMSFSNWTTDSYLTISGTQIPGVIDTTTNRINFSVSGTVVAYILARADDDVVGIATSTANRDSIGTIRIAGAPTTTGTTTVSQVQTIASVTSGQTETATFTSAGTVNSVALTEYTGVINSINAFATFNGSGNSLGTFNDIGGVSGLNVVVDTNHTYTEVTSIGSPGQPLDSSITVTRPDTGSRTSIPGVCRSQINTRYAALLGGPNLTNVNSPDFYMTINQPFPEDGPRVSGLISGPGATHNVVVNNNRQTLNASNTRPSVNTTHVRNGITYRYMRWDNAGNAYNRGNSGIIRVEIFIDVATGNSIVRIFGASRPAFNIPNIVMAPQTRTGRRLAFTNNNPNSVVLVRGTWGSRTVAIGETRTVTRDSTNNSWTASGTYQAVAGATTLRTFSNDDFVTTTLGNGVYTVTEADSPAISLTVTQGTVSQTILLEPNLTTMEALRQDIFDKLRSFTAFSGLDPTDASNTQPTGAVYFLSLADNNVLRFQSVATGSNDPLTFTYSTIVGTTSYSENQFGGNITDTITIDAGQAGDTPPIVQVRHERHGSADVILFGTNTSATVIDALGTTLANTGVWTYDSATNVLTATTVPTETNIDAENTAPTGMVISDPSNLLPANFAFAPTRTRDGVLASDDTPTFMITSPDGDTLTYQIQGTGTLTANTLGNELAAAIQNEDAFAGWLTEPPGSTGGLIQFVDLVPRDRTPVTGTRIEYPSVTGRWTVQLVTAGNTGTNTAGNAMFPTTAIDSVTTGGGGISQKFATPTSFIIRFSGLPAGENTRNIVIGTAGVRALDQTITTPGAVSGVNAIAEVIRDAIRADTVIGSRVTVGGEDAVITVEPNQFGEDAIYIEEIRMEEFISGTNPDPVTGNPADINANRGYEPPRVPDEDGPDFGQAANFTFDRLDFTSGSNGIETRLDLVRPWSSTQYNPNRLFPIFVQTESTIQDDGSITRSNRIRAADVGFTFNGTGYRSYVERATIGMTPEFDTEQLASVALWADGGTQLEVGQPVQQATLRLSVRGTNSPGEVTDLTVPDTDASETNRKVINDFAVGEDYKIDTRIHGRFVNYRLDDQGSFNNVEWNLSGLQFDITKGGRR